MSYLRDLQSQKLQIISSTQSNPSYTLWYVILGIILLYFIIVVSFGTSKTEKEKKFLNPNKFTNFLLLIILCVLIIIVIKLEDLKLLKQINEIINDLKSRLS